MTAFVKTVLNGTRNEIHFITLRPQSSTVQAHQVYGYS